MNSENNLEDKFEKGRSDLIYFNFTQENMDNDDETSEYANTVEEIRTEEE